jgi:hypothetical protein
MPEWKAIAGFEGLYEVSDDGQVRRAIDAPTDHWRSRINTWPGRLCKQRPNEDGYFIVGMWKDGAVKKIAVHRLVAVAFIGPRPSGHEVNHKDGNKANNAAVNLEYVTHGDNVRHAISSGLSNPYAASMKGEQHWKAKLTDSMVREIRSLKGTVTQPALAERFGVCAAMIGRIQRRECWRHVT